MVFFLTVHILSLTLQSTFPCPCLLHLLQMCLYLHFSADELHLFGPLNRWQMSVLSLVLWLFPWPPWLPSLAPSIPTPSVLVQLYIWLLRHTWTVLDGLWLIWLRRAPYVVSIISKFVISMGEQKRSCFDDEIERSGPLATHFNLCRELGSSKLDLSRSNTPNAFVNIVDVVERREDGIDVDSFSFDERRSCLSPPYSIWTPLDPSGLSPQPSLPISVMTGVEWSGVESTGVHWTVQSTWSPYGLSPL